MEIVDDPPTRSRILARIAVDLSLRDADAAKATAEAAITLARECQDRTALLESLMRSASWSLAPHSLTRRRSELREVLDLSSRSTDAATRYFALSASVVAAVQAGELAEAEGCIVEADAIAAHYELAPVRWSAKARRAWRAGLAGRFDEAEQLIDQAAAYGERHGISHASDSARLQRVALRWQQRRLIELIPTARAVCDEFGPSFPSFTLLLARGLAEDPRAHDEARALVSEVAENEFACVPRGTFWSWAMVMTAETALMLDLPEVSGTLRDLLLPFADQVAFTGLWVAAPIAYGVGLGMLGSGDHRAPQLFEQAAELAVRIQAPVFESLAREHLPTGVA